MCLCMYMCITQYTNPSTVRVPIYMHIHNHKHANPQFENKQDAKMPARSYQFYRKARTSADCAICNVNIPLRSEYYHDF